jgi:hypothetical protein
VDGFFMRRIQGKIAPFLKIESAERTILGIDDNLGLPLKKKGKRASKPPAITDSTQAHADLAPYSWPQADEN